MILNIVVWEVLSGLRQSMGVIVVHFHPWGVPSQCPFPRAIAHICSQPLKTAILISNKYLAQKYCIIGYVGNMRYDWFLGQAVW